MHAYTCKSTEFKKTGTVVLHSFDFWESLSSSSNVGYVGFENVNILQSQEHEQKQVYANALWEI